MITSSSTTLTGREGEPDVRGVALDRDQAQLTVTAVPDRPGSAAALCRALADGGISLDTIVQSERQRQSDLGLCRDIAFTLPRDDLSQASEALRPLLKLWPGAELVEGKAIARVSAVGAGMPSTAGQCRQDVPSTGRSWDQHRDDRHQRNPHQLRGARKDGIKALRKPCT